MANSETINPRRARRARSRGAATVEAAIALPVMIIVFAGALFVRDKYLAVADAEAQARTCAWLYSSSNCPNDPRNMPAGCAGVLTPGITPAAHSPDVDNAINQASDLATSGKDERGVIESVVSSMIQPVLAEVFGEYAQATTSASVARPALFGGGQANVGGNYHLACNVAPQTPSDVVKKAWDHLTD